MPDTYTVSVLPVRNSGAESSRRSTMPTWWQAVTPTSSIPTRIASSDAAGTPLRNASTPRTKSRWSIEELGRRLGREAVGELECADAGLDPIRCHDLGRDGCVVTIRLHAVAHRDLLSPRGRGASVDRSGPTTITSAVTRPITAVG